MTLFPAYIMHMKQQQNKIYTINWNLSKQKYYICKITNLNFILFPHFSLRRKKKQKQKSE